MVDRLVNTARSLATLPMRGRIVPELADTAYRKRFVHSYPLVYRVDTDRTLIIAVVHGRRLLEAADRFQE